MGIIEKRLEELGLSLPGAKPPVGNYLGSGASDLLIELFKENVPHARTATGVAQIPFGASVQLDIIFQMKAGI